MITLDSFRSEVKDRCGSDVLKKFNKALHLEKERVGQVSYDRLMKSASTSHNSWDFLSNLIYFDQTEDGHNYWSDVGLSPAHVCLV